MKTTAQGFPESQALAPPSASCAECLDNWMECFAGRVLAGSLGSDFKREGGEDAGSRKRLKRSVVGLEAPRPGLTNTTACPAPPCPRHGGEPESGPGHWGKDRTEGRDSRMVSEICGGQSGEVRPRRQSGLREEPGPGQHFDPLAAIGLSTTNPPPHFTDREVEVQRGQALIPGDSMLGVELGCNPGLLSPSSLFSLPRLSPPSPPAPETHTRSSQ